MTVIPIDRAQTVTDLKGKVQALISSGMTQATIAEKAGVSPASLSKWLNSKGKGSDDGTIFALIEWFAEKEADALESTSWIETPTARGILTAMEYTHEYRNIGVVYGGAGLGKTVTAQKYATDKTNVSIVTMTPASANISACLRVIATAIGVQGYFHRNSEVEQHVIAHLKNTGGLLIVDEAQHLHIPALETVRAVHDASGVAVVLMGNDVINKGLVGPRNDKFAQLLSRIGHKHHLERPKNSDVTSLANAWGVSGRKTMTELLSIGQEPGGLRGVVQVLKLATLICDGDSAKIDAAIVRRVWGSVAGTA